MKLVKYCERLENIPADKLVAKAYSVQKSLYASGFNVWYQKIVTVLSQVDLLAAWEQNVCPGKLSDFFKRKLFEQFIDNWKKDVTQYPVLRSYLLYKTEFEMEMYLKCIRDSKLRHSLAKLRLSSHMLAIETGRRTKPLTPCEQRLCKHCNLGVTEDEYHFMMICPLYLDQRIHLFTNILELDMDLLLDNDPKGSFINIMSNRSEAILFYVSKFIRKCFKLKESQCSV